MTTTTDRAPRKGSAAWIREHLRTPGATLTGLRPQPTQPWRFQLFHHDGEKLSMVTTVVTESQVAKLARQRLIHAVADCATATRIDYHTLD